MLLADDDNEWNEIVISVIDNRACILCTFNLLSSQLLSLPVSIACVSSKVI